MIDKNLIGSLSIKSTLKITLWLGMNLFTLFLLRIFFFFFIFNMYNTQSQTE
jgi:hypothetical protein